MLLSYSMQNRKTVHACNIIMLSIALFITLPASAKSNKSITTIPTITVEMAQKVAMAALQQCNQDGYAVSVAVVDRGGNLIFQVREPLAGPHTIGSSRGKAFASASLGQPTASLANLFASNPALQGLRDMDSRIVMLGGGLPIIVDGQRLGGIGVGGAPGDKLDEACAAQGLKQLVIE